MSTWNIRSLAMFLHYGNPIPKEALCPAARLSRSRLRSCDSRRPHWRTWGDLPIKNGDFP